MLLKASNAGHRCWFIVHRRELIRQTENVFKELGLDYGVIAAGRTMQPWKLVQICSVNTLARRIDKLEKPHLVAQDECHHLPCKSWSDVLTKIGRCYMVGLSASPIRLDSRGLADYFGAMVVGLSIRDLIAEGYLSPFRTFVPATVDVSGLHTRMGDYVTAEATQLMDKPSITGSAVAEYQKLCDGKRAIVFCVSIEHSKHVAAQFRDAGYAAVHIDGTFADEVRDGAIADFERGAIQILCNVDLCAEGLSINAIECVILLRPTQSLGLYIQQVGRGLRTWPGKKELTILDHVGMTIKFGLIDEPREWALTYSEDKKTKTASLSVRVCPKCFAASSARALSCSNCGEPFAVAPRSMVDEREGELVEITPEMIARKEARHEQGMAQSLEQLREIARRKGYSSFWADHVYAARMAKRAVR
jgi:superfamily II DNA or RNA helicase